MSSYLVRRVLEFIPAVVLIVLVNFLVVHSAPGDPAMIMAGEDAKPDYVAAIREKYGLDQPLMVQLWRYLRTLASGDLGYSLSSNLPVAQLILSRIPATLLLVLTSQVLALSLGIILGTYSGQREGSRTDHLLSIVAAGVQSVPVFWVGLLLILFFGLRLGWLPTFGMTSAVENYSGLGYWTDLIRHALLPIATLSLAYWPPFFRVTRASIIEVVHEDYIRVARAKGLSERRIFYHHALRNAIIPTASLAGLQFGFAVAGTVLVETVFGWPGIGTLMYNSIVTRDYPILMGVYIVVGISVLITSLITDFLYVVLDPRVAYH